ncbi:hypothetical protein [Neorhizobium sp. T6_25]|uniref:hypothetical protein n=1 Tax=Neorhizobium sp. T6_25 TaxID=2093833 RepID=UPI00155E998E|nr:hypothetical protein [Neorhizobium sp. T6_25]
MPDVPDLATAVATELAKQIPIKDAYSDALSPGMKQTGAAIEDITKTLRLALAPFQVGADFKTVCHGLSTNLYAEFQKNEGRHHRRKF